MKKGIVFSVAAAWCLAVIFLISHPAFAGRITYTYDDSGRLTSADYGDGNQIAYT